MQMLPLNHRILIWQKLSLFSQDPPGGNDKANGTVVAVARLLEAKLFGSDECNWG